MTLMKMMLHRRSVRTYTDEPIPAEKLKAVVNAGLAAPTGKNTGDREFIVVTDKETLGKLSETRIGAAKMLAGAGAAIVVFGAPQVSDTWIEDCSIALTQMHLMADALGLGSCWIQGRMRPAPGGETTEEAIRAILGVPEDFKLVATLSLGCIDSHPEPKKEEALDQTKVHCGTW
ncbi:MAG: nitroreductase family protein [Firmicutes bacterium]|nr:nitroreductase family protein [Bacillota bacterium]